jgi:hypothetical protein
VNIVEPAVPVKVPQPITVVPGPISANVPGDCVTDVQFAELLKKEIA